jgi:hypothetical protein
LEDLTYTGETSSKAAAGMNHSLKKSSNLKKQINGSTSTSGAGTPESHNNGCAQIGIEYEQGMSNSCGPHDIQSVLCSEMIQFVSEGELDSQKAFQLLCTISSLYLVLQSR